VRLEQRTDGACTAAVLNALSRRSKTAKEDCFGGDHGCACNSGLTARVLSQSLFTAKH
jgi:hypothetical protein